MNEFTPTKEMPVAKVDYRDPLIIEMVKGGVALEFVAKTEERLRDPITGLPDSRTCLAVMDRLLRDGIAVTVEFDDLLYLKTYNDLIGHPKTNEMLARIGERFRKIETDLREKGAKILIGRYAGDEFLKIIIGLPPTEARQVLDGVERELRHLEKPEGTLFRPHFSRGIASSTELRPGQTAGDLVALADQRAMEQKRGVKNKLRELAKRGGRNSAAAKFLRSVRRYG
ncbi:diguanylate cyclase [Candidatus Gottesmanbacteria bacterium]|nr:diguanylate cyclase [Candidatus Gottesmanbacteria bacterium]